MKKVAFIGAGNMNRAILIGLVNNGYDAKAVIVSNPSPEKREALANDFGVNQTPSNIEAANQADVIVLGVKPHFIKAVCKEIADNMDITSKCFISVAAGVSIAQIQSVLGNNANIIRCMPNTPSQLGLGMSGMLAAQNVAQSDIDFADSLLKSVGKVQWLANEDEMDNLITVSGSGPAYFFAFMEAMQKQALAFGFSEQTARELVQQTALGAAQMVVQNNESIATLRENVTSKGGTTYAALSVLAQNNLDQIVSEAMQACKARAIEMTEANDS